MKKIVILIVAMTVLMGTAFAQKKNDKDKDEVERMLDRFLAYVTIESQSQYPSGETPEEFPMQEGQREIARFIFDEIKSFGKGVEVEMSSDFYIYAKVPSNTKKQVSPVMFMAHLDVSPEAPGIDIRPQVHRSYAGGNIALGNGLVLSPDSPEGCHLKNLIGNTIVTSDGNTLLGGDDKNGCAILVSLIEQLIEEQNFEHGDVYCCFTQNEDIGLAAMRFDTSFFAGQTKELIAIDVDGGDVGQFSIANFTAEGKTVLFKGNLAHTSNAKQNGLADARTAMCYYVGQLPVDAHPSYSEGRQGYTQAYIIEDLNGGKDFRVHFRTRYFEKPDSLRFAKAFDVAYAKTHAAFPTVEIVNESTVLQYDNVAYSMHPQTIEVIKKAAKKTGVTMEPYEIRAGTTGAMMVARGLPGCPCIYAGQHAEHSCYEWSCIEELVQIKNLCHEIVAQVANLKDGQSYPPYH